MIPNPYAMPYAASPHAQPKKARTGVHATHGEVEHMVMRGVGYAGLAAGTVALAPIVTQAVAATNSGAWMAAENAINLCSSSAPIGWAASLAGGIKGIPLIGPALAAGGVATLGAAAGLAVAGMGLGYLLDKRQKADAFPWGKVVRWSLLASSMLVAAPMIFSGLTMGLTFLSGYFGAEAFAAAATTIGTLGSSGAFSGLAMAKGSAALMAVHALTCVVPIGLSSFLFGKKETPEPQLNGERSVQGRLMQLQRQVAAAG